MLSYFHSIIEDKKKLKVFEVTAIFLKKKLLVSLKVHWSLYKLKFVQFQFSFFWSVCTITDCKEGEDCIRVADIPSPKRFKLKLEENLDHKLVPGDGHFIANCFAVHFKENLF